jgi:serine/threonine protein kinase
VPLQEKKEKLRTSTRWLFSPTAAAAVNLVPGDTQPQPGILAESPSLPEDFEVIEVVGESAVCRVLKVKSDRLNGTLALKLLKDEFAHNPAAIKQFKREVDAATTLCHPNIVPVYGHGSLENNSAFVVERLCEGQNLAQVIQEDGPLQIDRALNLFTQICDGMAHAHSKGVVHSDLKPSNIVVSSELGQETASIIDFGIATVLQSARCATADVTKTGEVFGTPQYMSPEQCLGEKVDERSDIYSFGCLMYEALMGKPPFRGVNPVQIIMQHLNDQPSPFEGQALGDPKAPGLERIVLRCLQKDSANRFASFDDLKKEFQKLKAIKNKPTRVFYGAPSIVRRSLASLIDGALIFILVCTVDIQMRDVQLHNLVLHLNSPFGSSILTPLPAIVEKTHEVISSGVYFAWPASWLTILMERASFNRWVYSCFFPIVAAVYFVLFECSPFAASPGKLLMRLRVQTLSGERISTLTSFRRTLIKVIAFQCWLISCIVHRPKRASLGELFSSNTARLPTDELTNTRVVQKFNRPVRETEHLIRGSKFTVADAHGYRRRAAVLTVCILLLMGFHLSEQPTDFITWSLLIPPLGYLLHYHFKLRNLLNSRKPVNAPSWTTIFMRSLGHARTK